MTIQALRLVWASVVASVIGTMPYFGLCVVALSYGPASDGGAPAVGALAFAAMVAAGLVLSVTCLVLTGLRWRTRDQVVIQHLYGWPIGIAVLVFLFIAIPSAMGGWLAFLIAVAACAICALIGVAAAALWMRLSYHARTPSYAPDQAGAT